MRHTALHLTLATLLMGCPWTDTGTDSPVDSDTGTDSDIGTDSDTDPDSDTDVEIDTGSCTGILHVDTPFRLTGEGWIGLLESYLDTPQWEGVSWSDYEFQSNGSNVPGCSTRPPFDPLHDNPAGGALQLGIRASAGHQIRVRQLGDLRPATYALSGCEAGTACLSAMSPFHTNTVTVPETGEYVVALRSQYFDHQTPVAYDWLVEVLPPEDCTDGIDNDDDNYVDCLDSGCAAEPFCVQTCPVDVIPRGTSVRITEPWDTAFNTDRVDADCGISADVGGSRVIAIEALAGDEVVLINHDRNFQPEYQLYSTCPSDTECTLSRRMLFGARTALPIEHDGTYYVVIRAADTLVEGTFDTTIGIGTPEDCSTTADEDMDGGAGCWDSECFGQGSCPATCPEPEDLPIRITGDSFWPDYPDYFESYGYNGCLFQNGADIVRTVALSAGDTLQFSLLGGTQHFSVNITDAAAEDCFSIDTPTGCVGTIRTGTEGQFIPPHMDTFTAPHTGTFYLHFSSVNAFETGSYDWLVERINEN